MVISDRLLWLHIPKTAGDATLLMFKQLHVGWRWLDEHTDPAKHGTLAEARERVPGCDDLPVIANLRRLPEVVLSYFHHMQRHAPSETLGNGRSFGEIGFRDYLRYVLEHPDTQTYDWILNHHLGDRDVDHWLRVSDLSESFLRVVGSYHPVSESACSRIRMLRANEGRYERDLTARFTRQEMRMLYANSPRWSREEAGEYGGLLCDTLDWGEGHETGRNPHGE